MTINKNLVDVTFLGLVILRRYGVFYHNHDMLNVGALLLIYICYYKYFPRLLD